jgi:hypothetical protein
MSKITRGNDERACATWDMLRKGRQGNGGGGQGCTYIHIYLFSKGGTEATKGGGERVKRLNHQLGHRAA